VDGIDAVLRGATIASGAPPVPRACYARFVRAHLLVPFVLILGACGDDKPRTPNVLLISIDTLRADHLGCYGYGRATSPNLDRLAAEGALFEQHVSSSSWTLPAHAAIFTGLSDSGHGCTDVDKALEPRFETIAERFQSNGYATAGFFAGPFLHPAFGFGQGFDQYTDCTSYGAALDAANPVDWAKDDTTRKASHEDVANPRTFEAFQRWFGAREEKPFFAFVHLWDVHYDFTPPPPFDTRFDPDYTGWVDGKNFFFDERIGPEMAKRDLDHLIALYDGEIAWTDTYLAKIRDELERAGVLDDTVIVVTSDHGTEFFEHGWKGHRTTLYDEVIHVPLVVRYPKSIPAGMRVSAQTRSVDLAPTLLELCGLGELRDISGVSLLDLIREPVLRTSAGPRAISELDSVGRSLISVREKGWKVIGDRSRATARTFDLRTDPGEKRPIEDSASPLVATGAEALESAGTELQRLSEAHAGASAGSAPPPGVQKHLDDLGYTGQDAPPREGPR